MLKRVGLDRPRLDRSRHQDYTDAVFARSRCVVSRVSGEETLIVPVRGRVGDMTSIYSLNGTGSLLWQLLDSPKDLPRLIAAVEQDQVGEEARKVVTEFLDEMLSFGLVEVCSTKATSTAIPSSTEGWAEKQICYP